MRFPALAVIALALAASGSTAFPPVPPAKPAKPAFELKDLEGSWTVVRCEVGRDGKRTVTNETVHIEKGQWVAVVVFRDGNAVKTVAYALTLDAAKSPAVLDMTFSQQQLDGSVMAYGRKGVAALKGDQLTVVYTTGKARPASVEGLLTKGEERWVLRRQKP